MSSRLEELKRKLAAKGSPDVGHSVSNISSVPSDPLSNFGPSIPQTAVQRLEVQKEKKPVRQSNLPSELEQKVNELEAALLDRHPRMPTLLREIHTALQAQPENVTLLSEEEIAVIVNGLKVQTGVEFAAAAIKGGSRGLKAKINTLGVDAF